MLIARLLANRRFDVAQAVIRRLTKVLGNE